MGTWLRHRLTYANVASTLALLIALSGASYAAVKLAPNSVKSRHIADGTVKGKDVAKNAIKSPQIAPNQVRGADVLESTLGKVPRAADADTLGGFGADQFAASLERTIVVSPRETQVASGAALAEALASITDATSANPVLVWIEPGTYEVDDAMTVPSWTRLSGAGLDATVLEGDGALVLESRVQLVDLNVFLDVQIDGVEDVLLERMAAPVYISNADGVTFREGSIRALVDSSEDIYVYDADAHVESVDSQRIFVYDSALDSGSFESTDDVMLVRSQLDDVSIEGSFVTVKDGRARGSAIQDSEVTFLDTQIIDHFEVLTSTLTCWRSYDAMYVDLQPDCT